MVLAVGTGSVPKCVAEAGVEIFGIHADDAGKVLDGGVDLLIDGDSRGT